MRALILAIICVANTSFAEPILIRLLPDGKEAKEEIKILLDAAELSLSIKAMLHDSESITDSMKKDNQTHVINMPIAHTDERTVRALANALTQMQKLKASKKQLTYFSLKKIVTSCYLPNVATSKDFYNLMLTVNFLDIPSLLNPAVAAWVDQQQKDDAEFWKKLPQLLESVPKELSTLVDNYWSWLKNPINPIVHFDTAKALAVRGNELFALSRDENNVNRINIFDLETNKFTNNVEVKREQFSDLKIAGNRLYLASNLRVASIDVTQEHLRSLVFGQAFFDTPEHPIRLCFSSNKLCALQLGGHISWFDTRTNIAKKSSINTIVVPLKLKDHDDCILDDENLYVTQSQLNTVAVVDLKKRAIRVSIEVDQEPSALAMVGKKLYVANKKGNTVSVINLYTDRLEKTIKVGSEPVALAGVGELLFVANSKDKTLSVIDVFTNRIIDSPIALSSEPVAFTVSGKRLYVATIDGSIGYLKPEAFLYYGR